MYAFNKWNTILKPYLKLMRVYHWAKSLLAVCIGPITLLLSVPNKHSNNIGELMFTVIQFCLCSSLVYIINDLSDIERDKAHTKKCFRPLPSGDLSIKAAWSLFSILTLIVITISIVTPLLNSFIAITYIVLNVLYSYKLKHVPILEMLVVSFGFILRIIAGYLAFESYPEPWLLGMVMSGSMLLIIGKRREELRSSNEYSVHRPVLDNYSEELLNTYLIIAVIACLGCSIGAAAEFFYTIELLHQLFISIPFIIYIFLRYLLLAFKSDITKNPTKLLLRDFILHRAILWWGILSMLTYKINSFTESFFWFNQ